VRNLRPVFWIHTLLAAATAMLGALTLVQPAWIERLLPLDPDNSSGALEWKLVVALFVGATAFSALAIRTWRGAPQTN